MKQVKTIIMLMFVLALFVQTVSAQSGYKIVVNKSNSISQLSQSEVSRMFLKKTQKWSDGISVAPVDLVSDSPVREAFTKNVLKKNTGAVKSFWQSQIFTGAGLPPKEVTSDREVLNWVESNPGGIGYVSSNTSLSGMNVKVIQVN